MNRNKLENLMKTMRGVEPTEDQMKTMVDLASKYGNKNEEDIMQELKNLGMDIKEDKDKYQKQLKAMEQLKEFLNDEQKQKLEDIMRLINDSKQE